MRRCECSVRSPSKRTNRCLPCASTERTAATGQALRPAVGLVARMRREDLLGTRWSSSTARTRRAALWIVSPSGIAAHDGRASSRHPGGSARATSSTSARRVGDARVVEVRRDVARQVVVGRAAPVGHRDQRRGRIARAAGDHAVGRRARAKAALQRDAQPLRARRDQVAQPRARVALHPHRPLGLQHHQMRRADRVEVDERRARRVELARDGARRTRGCRPAASPRRRRTRAARAGPATGSSRSSSRQRDERGDARRGCRWRPAPCRCARCPPPRPCPAAPDREARAREAAPRRQRAADRRQSGRRARSTTAAAAS